jgi:flagellar motor switch protein FliG
MAEGVVEEVAVDEPPAPSPAPQRQARSSIPGRRKAAMLCVSIGPEAAAEVFRHLPPELVESLTVEMARTPTVEPAHADRVLEEAIEAAYARGYIAEGGVAFAREVLERALGPAKASEVLSRLQTVIEQTPFEFLRGTPPDQLAAFLRGEHPQTVALVVANLPTNDLAANVLMMLPPEEQAEVALRIARMGQTPPDVVKDVARVLRQKVESVLQREYAAAGGAPALAQILNSSDRATERNVLERLGQTDAELADEVRSLLFVFEDILKLDDRSIQLVLKEIDAKDLALALRGASEEVQERIVSNMSQRAAEMLKEEMEYMPPQRRKVVEEAQSKVVAAVRKLEEAGSIVVARGSGDEDLVF